MMEACKNLIRLAIAKEFFIYQCNISYGSLSLKSVQHWLLLRPIVGADVAGHLSPFFNIFTLIQTCGWVILLLLVICVLVTLTDLNKDKKFYVPILIMELSLRFWISKVFKFLLVLFEFNEISRLVLKPSRTDKIYIYVCVLGI